MAEIGSQFVVGGRKLSQLKVDELKLELEKRGLKKSGNKPALIERLSEVLFKELYESPEQQHQAGQAVPQQNIPQFQGQQPVTPHSPSFQSQQQAVPQQYQQIPSSPQLQQGHQPQNLPFYQQGHQQGNMFAAQQQSVNYHPHSPQKAAFLPQMPMQQQAYQQQVRHQGLLQHVQQQQHTTQPLSAQDTLFQQGQFGQGSYQQGQQDQLFQQLVQENLQLKQFGQQIPQQASSTQQQLAVQPQAVGSTDNIQNQEAAMGVSEKSPEQSESSEDSVSSKDEHKMSPMPQKCAVRDSEQPTAMDMSAPISTQESEPQEGKTEESSSSSSSAATSKASSPSRDERSGQPSPATEPSAENKDESSSATEEYRSEPSSPQRSEEPSPAPAQSKEGSPTLEEAALPPGPAEEEVTVSPTVASREATPPPSPPPKKSTASPGGSQREATPPPSPPPKKTSPPPTMETTAAEQDKDKDEVNSLEEGEVPNSPEPVKADKDEIVFEVEPSEVDKAVVEEPKRKIRPPIITKKRKISIASASSQSSTPTHEPGGRKRRWGSYSKTKSSMKISTDSLKDIIPDVQVHSTPAFEALMDLGKEDLDYEPDTKEPADDEADKDKENRNCNADEDQPMEEAIEKEVEEPEVVTPRKKKERIVKVEEGRRKIKINRQESEVSDQKGDESMDVEEAPSQNPDPKLDDPDPKPTIPICTQSPVRPERSPSPARNPESVHIHVVNLVRPFTQRQLKDLLGQTGTLEEDGFWMDRIKSHCYAVYTNLAGATATRAALHGVKWPPTSPKILSVDYADNKKMLHDTGGVLGKKVIKQDVKMEELREDLPTPVETQQEEKPVAEEDDDKNPANLLDNLFRKTKTTPCLYWLPLTSEQAEARHLEKEERKKQRQEELAKEEEDRKEKEREREKLREQEQEREREKQRQREKEREERMRARDRSRGRSRDNRPRPSSPINRRRSSRSRSRSFRRR